MLFEPPLVRTWHGCIDKIDKLEAYAARCTEGEDPQSFKDITVRWILGAAVNGAICTSVCTHALLWTLNVRYYSLSAAQIGALASATAVGMAQSGLMLNLARKGLHQNEAVRITTYSAAACCVAFLALGSALLALTMARKGMWTQDCLIMADTRRICAAEFSHGIAFIIASIVMLPSVGLYTCWRLLGLLTSNSTHSRLIDEELVPPSWHIPPAQMAEDSSDSGAEGSSTRLLESSSAQGRPDRSEHAPFPSVVSPVIDKSRWSKVRSETRNSSQVAY